MHIARLFGAFASIASMAMLGHAALADTPVQLLGTMVADTIPYGQPQTFTVGPNSYGKKCSFSFAVQLNGRPVGIQGYSSTQPTYESVALPWTSPDLRLPSSNGQKYTLTLTPTQTSTPNACTGQAQLLFDVVPQIGKLTSLTANVRVAAVNQPVTFNVTGTSFGYCRYQPNITYDGVPYLRPTPSTTLPVTAAISFPNPGDYVATEDEIDDSGVPEGCTGHLKVTVTVVPRPTCPSASGAKYYDSADDSEYGCFLSNQTYSGFPPAYSCPSYYTAFGDMQNSAGWGCRQTGKPPLPPGTVATLIDGAPVPPAPSATPSLAKPTLVSVHFLPPGGGTGDHADERFRPFSDAFFVGEHVKVKVTGNIPNTGGFDPTLCTYRVDLEDTTLANLPTNINQFTEFSTFDLGAVPLNGVFRVHAYSAKNPKGPEACLGDVEEKPLDVFPDTAFITDFKIVGFAFHFNAGDDMAMDQFCSNCTSIFSPAHNREFLGFQPTIRNLTGGKGVCAYTVTMSGTSAERGGGSFEVQYKNGDPTVPGGRGLAFPTPLSAPWWTEYNNDSNTVTVTVTPAKDPNIPSCNVLHGKLSKSITFTKDLNAKPVEK